MLASLLNCRASGHIATSIYGRSHGELTDARCPASFGLMALSEKVPHRLKVKGDRVGFEEIVPNHAGKVEAKSVFPRERPIVETCNVVFLDVSEGKATHGVGHDFQLSSSARSFVSLVLLKLDPCLLDDGLRQLDTRSRISARSETRLSDSPRPSLLSLA